MSELLGNIIVLAAVAAFILLRYRSMLGEQRGRDPNETKKPKATLEDLERIIQLPQKAELAKPELSKESLAPYDDATRAAFLAFQRIDMDFNPDDFIEGAKSAFEMLISAYREGDRDTLKMLLSKELYDDFDKSLKTEDEAGKRTQGTVIAISKAEIREARIKGTQATIEVQFMSDQIQVTRDKDNVIIEGDASHEVEIDDHWVFTRDLKSLNPNWTIIET